MEKGWEGGVKKGDEKKIKGRYLHEHRCLFIPPASDQTFCFNPELHVK